MTGSSFDATACQGGKQVVSRYPKSACLKRPVHHLYRAFSFSGCGVGIGNSQQGEGFGEMSGVAAQGSGHIGMPGTAHQGDDQVA